MNKEEIKNEFINCIEGTHTLNLAISVLEDREELKAKVEQLELENFNLREDIMIKKKAFPNKMIKDKTFYDLFDMPTYEDLKEDIKNLVRIISKNCDDLEATEEEFESLCRWENE